MKKWLIKIICGLLSLTFITFCACNDTPDLYQKGVEITTIMGEMIESELYVETMGPSHVDLTLVKAKDYDTPTRAYKISVPSFDTFIQKMGTYDKTQIDEFNELSDNLKEQIENKFSFQIITNWINSKSGNDELVISTIFNARNTYNGKISSSVAYLYTFETGKPIVVLFAPFGDKQFTASGNFIFAKNLSSLSEVRELFEPFGCFVEKVK